MPPRHRPPRPHSSPLQILTQILTLQLLYYLCATGLLLFAALTAGNDPPFGADRVLSWRGVRGDTAAGWAVGGCWVVAGGMCGCVEHTFTFTFT